LLHHTLLKYKIPKLGDVFTDVFKAGFWSLLLKFKNFNEKELMKTKKSRKINFNESIKKRKFKIVHKTTYKINYIKESKQI
jgi:hypothetical protein